GFKGSRVRERGQLMSYPLMALVEARSLERHCENSNQLGLVWWADAHRYRGVGPVRGVRKPCLRFSGRKPCFRPRRSTASAGEGGSMAAALQGPRSVHWESSRDEAIPEPGTGRRPSNPRTLEPSNPRTLEPSNPLTLEPLH